MKKLTADERRELFKAMAKEGYVKSVIQKIFADADESVLRAFLVNVRAGLPVSKGVDLTPVPSGGMGKVLKGAKREADDFLNSQEQNSKTASDAKNTVLYSFKIGVSDLEQLKRISDSDGESVSVLLRQAVRSFLAIRGRR